MKKLFAVAALSAMLSTPAFAADSDSESFDINANVAETCTMEGISDIELGTLSINTNAGSNALFLNGASADNAGEFWLSCNESNRMSIVPTLGKLKNQTPTLQPGDDAAFKDTQEGVTVAATCVGRAAQAILPGLCARATRCADYPSFKACGYHPR